VKEALWSGSFKTLKLRQDRKMKSARPLRTSTKERELDQVPWADEKTAWKCGGGRGGTVPSSWGKSLREEGYPQKGGGETLKRRWSKVLEKETVWEKKKKWGGPILEK